jgi:hypothetical protein
MLARRLAIGFILAASAAVAGCSGCCHKHATVAAAPPCGCGPTAPPPGAVTVPGPPVPVAPPVSTLSNAPPCVNGVR